ncbi:24452_t:CDS:2 [Gigaspora rosea]|nr:24452_t:CDS:2 [Gigaspora rosea]
MVIQDTFTRIHKPQQQSVVRKFKNSNGTLLLGPPDIGKSYICQELAKAKVDPFFYLKVIVSV